MAANLKLTPRTEWPKVGDTVRHIQSGMLGSVLRTHYDGVGANHATVRWENGHTGRVSPANLRKTF